MFNFSNGSILLIDGIPKGYEVEEHIETNVYVNTWTIPTPKKELLGCTFFRIGQINWM